MAFYMEYPRRKVPAGIPPAQHLPEPPSLPSAVKNLVENVSKSAQEVLSPRSCNAPMTTNEALRSPPPPPSTTPPAKKGTQKSPLASKSQKSSGNRAPGILYPSRTMSPRPMNQHRVTWPDQPPSRDDDTQKQELPKNRLRASIDDMVESLTFISPCVCGPQSNVEDDAPPLSPPPPLETVYDLERNVNNLSIRTDFDEVEPAADDPILSFRKNKLAKHKRPAGVDSEDGDGLMMDSSDSSDDNDFEQRDEIVSDGNDWAPVTRHQPIPHQKLQLQQQIRDAALRRQDELQERLLHKKETYPEVTPRSQKVVEEALFEDIPSEMPCSTGNIGVTSHRSGRTWQFDEKSEPSPRRKKSLRLLGLRGRAQKDPKSPKPQHFAEIEWKHREPPSPQDQMHVAEIPWKTHDGRKVAKMKQRYDDERAGLEYYVPTPEDREWEREIKQVLRSPPTSEYLSSGSEDFGGDRFNRSESSGDNGGSAGHRAPLFVEL